MSTGWPKNAEPSTGRHYIWHLGILPDPWICFYFLQAVTNPRPYLCRDHGLGPGRTLSSGWWALAFLRYVPSLRLRSPSIFRCYSFRECIQSYVRVCLRVQRVCNIYMLLHIHLPKGFFFFNQHEHLMFSLSLVTYMIFFGDRRVILNHTANGFLAWVIPPADFKHQLKEFPFYWDLG